MKDNYSKIVTDIAVYYKQDLSFDGEIHPKIAALKEWMIEEIKEENLGSFKSVIFKKFDWFPKISELEKIKKGNPEIKAEKAWRLLVNKSNSDNIMITDPYAFKVVSGFGDWHSFCSSRDGNKDWTHKDFIKRYVMFLEDGVDEVPKILFGSFRVLYGALLTGVRTVIVGDKELGKKLLENNSSKSVAIDSLLSEIETSIKVIE